MPPAIPATIIQIGETPSNQINSALTMGIQTVFHVIPAALERLKMGPRMRAVTVISTVRFSR